MIVHSGCQCLCNILRKRIGRQGDYHNIRGLGIAMANAQEAVKRVCDFVTKSNEEEGVAYAIDRFILG